MFFLSRLPGSASFRWSGNLPTPYLEEEFQSLMFILSGRVIAVGMAGGGGIEIFWFFNDTEIYVIILYLYCETSD